MDGDQQSRFLHLNRDGRWLGLRTAGLELGGDGLLRLASLPLLTGSPPEGLAELDAPSGPAGIAVGPDGTRYWSDPAGHRLLADGPCAGDAGPVCCVGGEGGRPTQLRLPRGVCFHRLRRALLVADSGNHRIQLLDPASFQLLDLWGQPDPSGEPEPGDEPGRFDTPLALADDADGSVYVVDHGNRRVQKLDLYGRPVAGFWETVRGEAGLRGPSAVAVDPRVRPVRVHILDPELPALVVLDEHGHLLQTVRPALTAEAMGLAVARGAVYAGDNGLRRVRKWEPDGTPTGEARGYAGPVAGLAFDARADLLLVHPGDGAAPVELARTGAHASRGVLWGGPFANTSIRPEQWHRLTAAVEPLGPGAHLRLLTAADTGAPPPVDPAADEPFAAPAWQPLPPDVTEGIFPGAPLTGLWVGAQFASAGLRSPALAQLRLDFDRDTWLPYLPPIYQRDPASRELLIRLLSLFDSLFGEVEARIGGLGVLLDPAAIPAELLGWLAGWLALELPDDLAEADRRRLIAEVFDLYARRGTVQGLSAALRRSGGVDARIAEPILHAAWWSLAPDTAAAPVEAAASVLGLSTMLAPAEAQGAVVGTTAVLDQSHLISGEEFGLPLFEDVAHQFSVAVYRGPHYSDEALAAVRATLDREKPAHTAYHLCLIEPRMRVGFQATLGVDSVVAGPAGPTLLGATTPGGADLVLGGTPPGRIGEDRVGRTTRLGDATVRA